MDQLPLVILLHTVEHSLETWKSFVFSHPRVGRWSLRLEYQKYIQRKYTQCIEYQSHTNGIIREYKLCGKLHNVDGPLLNVQMGLKNGMRMGYVIEMVFFENRQMDIKHGIDMVYFIEIAIFLQMEPKNGGRMVDFREIFLPSNIQMEPKSGSKMTNFIEMAYRRRK